MMTQRLTQQAHDYQVVEQAIRFLEANFRLQPSLDDVAASVHLSKYHFQRLFKRWAGVSPTQFMQYLTVEYAKERLAASHSVLDAALDAGLSSPSRLHDLFVTFEAITPGEYKRQGAGLHIVYGVHDTPFGRCLLATTPRGICALYFLEQEAQGRAILGHDWPLAVLVEDGGQTAPVVDRIFSSADDRVQPFPLFVKGTNFQVKVWQALLTIPPAAMVSYGDVAGMVGQPQAARAVGHAIGQNPVSYLIPCHRVIRQVGDVHRYRWGTARKRAMLGWEAGRQLPA